MTSISSVIQSMTNSTTVESADDEASSTLDSDAFLELLCTQLEYQDPTEPMDTNDMMQQLAILTQVQYMGEMNDTMTDLSDTMTDIADYMSTSNEVTQGSAMIGQTVEITDSTSDDEVVTGTVTQVNFYDDGSTVTLDDGEEYLLSDVTAVYSEDADTSE